MRAKLTFLFSLVFLLAGCGETTSTASKTYSAQDIEGLWVLTGNPEAVTPEKSVGYRFEKGEFVRVSSRGFDRPMDSRDKDSYRVEGRRVYITRADQPGDSNFDMLLEIESLEGSTMKLRQIWTMPADVPASRLLVFSKVDEKQFAESMEASRKAWNETHGFTEAVETAPAVEVP